MNKGKDDFIWAGLFHMGTNMWNDSIPEKGWEPYVGEYRSECSPEHLKGFLMTTWHFTLPQWGRKDLEAIEQVAEAMSL